MSCDDKWPIVEIHRGKERSPSNYLKINGKMFEGLRNAEIFFGIKEPYPIVKIEFYAKEIKGMVQGNLTVKETRMEDAEGKIIEGK